MAWPTRCETDSIARRSSVPPPESFVAFWAPAVALPINSTSTASASARYDPSDDISISADHEPATGLSSAQSHDIPRLAHPFERHTHRSSERFDGGGGYASPTSLAQLSEFAAKPPNADSSAS